MMNGGWTWVEARLGGVLEGPADDKCVGECTVSSACGVGAKSCPGGDACMSCGVAGMFEDERFATGCEGGCSVSAAMRKP